jgi:uncharacterized membrane protein
MFIKLFIIALSVFFVIDMVWLVLVAKKFYQEQIGFLMKPNINWLAAIIFYLLFIAGHLFRIKEFADYRFEFIVDDGNVADVIQIDPSGEYLIKKQK